MRHHRRAHDALDRGDYRAAADESRRGIAAAFDVGATFFVNFNLVTLTQALSLSGDHAANDLGVIARALAEQRDAGQVVDQWLLLSGTAGILLRHGQAGLARDVLSGMLSSPWESRTPSTLRLALLLGVDVEGHVYADPVPELDELVDRALAAIDGLSLRSSS